jgi:5-methylcytosine-specific restriction endonuclease McrA
MPLERPEIYDIHMVSEEWANTRHRKFATQGGRRHAKCECCGCSDDECTLEIHHRDYLHFTRERMEDLQILCEECHPAADEERKHKLRNFITFKGNKKKWPPAGT